MSENECFVIGCTRVYAAGRFGKAKLHAHQRRDHNMIIPTQAEINAATYTAVGIAFRDNMFGVIGVPWWCVHCRAVDPQMRFVQMISIDGKQQTPKTSALKHAKDCPNRPR